MNKKKKAIIDNRILKTFGMALLFFLSISLVYSIEGCKGKTKTELYNALCEKEQILRILEDESGKGSKRSSDDEDDFDE